MTSLLRSLSRSSSARSLSLDEWANYFSFNGLSYGLMGQTSLGGKEEAIGEHFQGYVGQAYKQNGIVFACMLVRLLLFSEARFQFRRRRSGRPGELFGTDALSVLETPWPGATTGDLLTRAIQDADLAGNFYAARRGDRIQRLRPDWTTIVIGSQSDPEVAPGDLDAEVIGYVYQPGGAGSGRPAVPLMREQVCHFAPIPDPTASFRGMSWLSPIVTEIVADKAATTHKLKYFEQGATANLVVSLDAQIKQDAFDRWIAAFEKQHKGAANAYRTLYLGAGADAKVIGSDMKQVDFKATTGAGETRIAAAAGVPPVIVGLSEGLDAATYCLPAEERVWTLDGPRSIADVAPGDDLWATGDGTVRASKVTWQGCVGTKEVFLIRTKNRELRATANHPVLVRVPGHSKGRNPERSARTEWRQVADLRPGDSVIQAVGLPDADVAPACVSEQLAQWLGAYVGDGCGAGNGGIQMALPPADRCRDTYERLSVDLFDARITYGDRSFRLAGTDASKQVAEMGFAGTAKTKRIPGWVFRLARGVRLRFLAGLLDTDGSVDRRGVGALGFANRELVEQARALFVSCGVQVSNVGYRRQLAAQLPEQGRHESYDFWSFAISTGLGRVPTADPLYSRRLRARRDAPEGCHSRNPALDPDTLGAFIVRSIQSLGEQPVYDISVAGDQSFLAGGIAVHNSNYAQARRRLADGTMRPLWRNMAGSLATIVPVPGGSELWYDDRDIPFLQEDLRDTADIRKVDSDAIKALTEAGYDPASVVEAITAGDLTRLRHTGVFSVQLQPPGSGQPTNPAVEGENGRRLLEQFVGD